jgi:hypothetical protein
MMLTILFTVIATLFIQSLAAYAYIARRIGWRWPTKVPGVLRIARNLPPGIRERISGNGVRVLLQRLQHPTWQ